MRFTLGRVATVALPLFAVGVYAHQTADHGCPFAVRDVQAASVHEREALRTLVGTERAPDGPIFSVPTLAVFSPTMDTRAFGVCTLEQDSMRCSLQDTSTQIRFAQDGSLASWDTQVRFDLQRAGEAITTFQADAVALAKAFGTAHQRTGDAAAMMHPTRQLALRYRYQNRAVDLVLTHLGDGFVLHRQVRTLQGAIL
jgi:hypothetical protein